MVTTGAPLSEPSQKITADVDAEKDKGSEVQIEAHPAQYYTVYQEDEKFEWREAIRGALCAFVV